MPEANDMDLVREFARRDSEPAFTELVHRHINLVYSVALRYVGNAEDSQDVAQAVFIILAQKAAGLREGTVLTGWLYETTRFTAARLLRARARRQAREQEAYMQSTTNAAETDSAWRQVAPLLEDAMARLTEKERALLALRFYENKTGAEAATAMGIREAAAHKSAARAVEKLRAFFARRGIALSSVAIVGAVSANSVNAAPAALAKTISAVAITKGSIASISILTLVKGTMQTITWLKIKFAMIISATALLVGGAASVVVLAAQSPQLTQAPELTTNSPIILHVQHPPWIKHIRYRQSELLMAGPTPNHIERTWQAELKYEAGLQPSGFYGELLPPGFHPPSQSMPGERSVFGVSTGSVWKINWQGDLPNQIRQLAVSSRMPEQGGSPDDSVQAGAWLEKSRIERVNLFGLPPLLTNSFTLGEHNEFEAATERGEDVQGRFGDVTNDKPYSLAFSVSDSTLNTPRQFVVKYHYASTGAPLPNRYEFSEVSKKISKQNERTTTNWLEEIEYGIDPEITDGYSPSLFFSNLNTITWTTIFSNNASYLMTMDGKFQQLKEQTASELEAEYRRLSPPHRRSKLLYLISGAMMSVPIIWAASRYLGRKKS